LKKEIMYGPIGVLAIWYLVYFCRIINPLFLPPPHIVLIEAAKLFFIASLWGDIFSTLYRIVVGFGIACIIGIPLGLLMGYYKKVNGALELVVDFFRSLPALAVFPLLMFFFGIGDGSKIATTVFSCSLILAVSSAYGVTNSKKTRQIVAYLMEASRSEIFRKVILLDALPQISIGMRTALSLAVVVVVVTEMFLGTNWGIGHRIFEAQLTYKVPEMYAYIIYAGLLGYGLNKGFLYIEHRMIHWSGK
jgi:ABC-type nitrate/sulfonate/bicarbonate transport system permease component